MYYALVREAKSRPPTEEELQSYVDGLDEAPDEVDLATISVTTFSWQHKSFKRYKAAFKAVTPMLDELVPHVHNGGFVTNQHPSKLPLDKLATGASSKVLKERVKRQFFVPESIVKALDEYEAAVAAGDDDPPRDTALLPRDRPWELAAERGKRRRAFKQVERSGPRLAFRKLPGDLGRDDARKVASLLQIPGRGKMGAQDLRNAIYGAIAERRLGVEVDEALTEPELRDVAS